MKTLCAISFSLMVSLLYLGPVGAAMVPRFEPGKPSPFGVCIPEDDQATTAIAGSGPDDAPAHLEEMAKKKAKKKAPAKPKKKAVARPS